ncbi:MAG: hypothetical protein RR673_00185 [Erysipelotrichaceae bacterium]
MKKKIIVFISTLNEKKKKDIYWVASNKGFLSFYALTFLSIIMFIGMLINQQVYQLWYLKIHQHQQSMIEYYTLKHVKENWSYHDNYDETISYKQFEIKLHYEDELIIVRYVYENKKVKFKIIYDEICSCIMNISYQ